MPTPPSPRRGVVARAGAAALGALLALALALTAAQAVPLEVRVADRAGQPLADAVVYLESPAARAAVRPATGIEMAQSDRQFVPGVVVVPVGTELRFPNRDRVRHHVYSISPAKTFELKLFLGNEANPVLFDRPGVAVLGCNIHDEMIGWVVVVETPWYGRTDAQGRVRIDAPPGSHRLLAWHPDLPPGAPAQAQPLTLPPAGAQLTLTLPLGAAAAQR